MATLIGERHSQAIWRDYLELTKPKVVVLMLITSLVGMFLATRAGALMEDAEARARLRKGAEELAARFRWPAIAEETRAFLHSVLAGRPLRLKKTKGESLPLPAA